MVDVTLLEVNLDGSTLTANTPFSGSSNPDEGSATVGGVENESGGGRGTLLAAIVGLVFVLVIAAVAKRKLGGGALPSEDLEP